MENQDHAFEDYANSTLEEFKDSHVAKASSKLSIPLFQPKAAMMFRDLAYKHCFKMNEECVKFKGSELNGKIVLDAVRTKYGDDVVANCVLGETVRPKTGWLQLGFIVKQGEQPLCEVTSYRKGNKFSVSLYHLYQVQKG